MGITLSFYIREAENSDISLELLELETLIKTQIHRSWGELDYADGVLRFCVHV